MGAAGGGLLVGPELELLLPGLHTLVLLRGSDERALTAASDVLSAFIDEQGVGRPVNVEPQDLSRLWR